MDIFSTPGRDSDSSLPAILQRSHSLEYPVPSEHLETHWRSGGHGERATRHCLRVDGTRKSHRVYQKQSRQQTGTGMLFCSSSNRFAKMWPKKLLGAAQGVKYLHGADLVHGNLKGVNVSSSRQRYLFLTYNRLTSLCPTTTHHAPASRTSALCKRSSILSGYHRARRLWGAGRLRLWLLNSWYPADLVLQNRYPRGSRTFMHSH